jgi:hypothetical protein
MCYGSTATLTASGSGTTFIWLPGAFTGVTHTVNPNVSSIYTLQTSNGVCSNSAVVTLSVNPDFVVTAVASPSLVCLGDAAIITASGTATSYTINPGAANASTAVVTPVGNTSVVVSGGTNGCIKTTSLTVSVSPHFNVGLSAPNMFVCMGEEVVLTATGAVNYSLEPGGLSGSVIAVTPSTSVEYTVTGEQPGNACKEKATYNVVLSPCTGLDAFRSDEGEIRVYPNPSDKMFTVEFKDGRSRSVEVINPLGQIVEKAVGPNRYYTFISEGWIPGFYFIKVIDLTTGTVHVVKEVVKQ